MITHRELIDWSKCISAEPSNKDRQLPTLQLELTYLNQQRLHPAQQYTENITDRKFIFIIKLPNQDHNTKLIR